MRRRWSMPLALGLAAMLPAVSACGDSRASTSAQAPAKTAVAEAADAGGGGAAAPDRAEGSADQPSPPAPARVGPEPLHGGYDSLDALGEAVVRALSDGDEGKALAVVVDTREFKTRLFPALVNHPSALKLGPDLAWSNMAGEGRGDLRTALSLHGARPWQFVRIEASRIKDRGEIRTYLDPRLVVVDPEDPHGAERSLRILGPIIEHRASGTFKLLRYGD